MEKKQISITIAANALVSLQRCITYHNKPRAKEALREWQESAIKAGNFNQHEFEKLEEQVNAMQG